MLSSKSKTALADLARRFRALRIKRNERQRDFAARLGVSIPTLRKIERGDPTVAIGTWFDAIWLMDRIDDLSQVMAERESLFEQWEMQQKHSRRRASGK